MQAAAPRPACLSAPSTGGRWKWPPHSMYSSSLPGQLQPEVDDEVATRRGWANCHGAVSNSGGTVVCVTLGKSFNCFHLLFSHLLIHALPAPQDSGEGCVRGRKHERAWKALEGGAHVVTIVCLVSFLPILAAARRVTPTVPFLLIRLPGSRRVRGLRAAQGTRAEQKDRLGDSSGKRLPTPPALLPARLCRSAEAVLKRRRAPCLFPRRRPSDHTLVATFLLASPQSSRLAPPRAGEPPT